MWQTIRVRLTLWFVGLLVLLLLVFAGIITFAEARNESVELDEMLRDAVDWGVASVERPGAATDTPRVSPAHEIFFVRVVTPAGTVLRLLAGSQAVANGVPIRLDSGPWRTVRMADGRRVRAYRQVTAHGEIIEAAGAIQDREELVRLLSSLAFAAVPTFAAAVLAALFLAERALRPMGAITRMARDLGAGDLSRRIALHGPRDEIKQLADTFDAMLERLDHAFAAQQRFVGDASHELRTPLTIMRGHAEVALADPHASAAELRGCLEIIVAELRRLTGLAEDLLTLQRADAGTHLLSRECVDLGALTEEIVEDLRSLASGRHLGAVCAPGVMTWLDPAWFRQLLINLVENAVNHTPEEGTISVTVRQDAAGAILAVQDTGAGIAAEHLPRLFDRFYRVAPERSRAHGGVGLGLAIVAWIVAAHDGTVRVTSEPGHGATFTIAFPLASLPAAGVPNER